MLTHAELEELDNLLLSLPMDDNAMLLSEFDGFCAGLIVCPEMIMPGEWLPYVWGDGYGHFEQLKDTQRAIDLIMWRYNDVAQSLSPPKSKYGPLYFADKRTDDIFWEPWVVGFQCAMCLRPEAWLEIGRSDDREAATAINMMVMLYNLSEGESGASKKEMETLAQAAPDIIPELVLTLNNWPKNQSNSFPLPPFTHAANSPLAEVMPFSGEKIGRNAPCPCGSDLKYKRCCGSN